MTQRLRGLSIVLAIFFGGCVPIAPQKLEEPGQHALVFTKPGGSKPINYLLYIPEGVPKTGTQWPMILYLHGRSLRGDDPERVKVYGIPKRLEKEKSFPFVVVSPQLREDERWTDTDTLVALVDDVASRYQIDKDRIYLTGFSMGGGGAWRVAGAHPDRFAAVATLAGTADLGTVKGLAKVPLWAFHGDKDESTPLADSEKMVEAIKAAGGDAKLTVLEGRDHNIADLYDGEEIYSWFLEHTRKHERRGQ